MLHAFAGDVYFHRSEVEGADVLGEVASMRVIGRMREDRVGVVVDACDDLRALTTIDPRPLDACRGSAGTAKKVDVEKSNRHDSKFRSQFFNSVGEVFIHLAGYCHSLLGGFELIRFLLLARVYPVFADLRA